ncbi:MAG TPA: GDP-mannose 4,6-dehydratase, partial [Ignavibacteria bacterium]
MFKNIYKDKKVLITGNTGFKGSWLTIWLLRLGAKVYGISKDIPTEPSIFADLDLGSKIKYFQEDLRNLNKLSQIVNEIKPDFVFHLAAQPLVVPSYLYP